MASDMARETGMCNTDHTSNTSTVSGRRWRPGVARKTGHQAVAKPAAARAAEVGKLKTEVKKLRTEVTSLKHEPKRKHTGTGKHSAKRGLSPGEALPACAAEALAASLRLSGGHVSDDDVLALFLATPGADESGATLLATLETAARLGLGSRHPRYDLAMAGTGVRRSLGLILGLDLPGPHAVFVGPDGAWWSWGEPYDPFTWPDAVVEEAWAVTWS